MNIALKIFDNICSLFEVIDKNAYKEIFIFRNLEYEKKVIVLVVLAIYKNYTCSPDSVLNPKKNLC